jgi:hypothetical protein
MIRKFHTAGRCNNNNQFHTVDICVFTNDKILYRQMADSYSNHKLNYNQCQVEIMKRKYHTVGLLQCLFFQMAATSLKEIFLRAVAMKTVYFDDEETAIIIYWAGAPGCEQRCHPHLSGGPASSAQVYIYYTCIQVYLDVEGLIQATCCLNEKSLNKYNKNSATFLSLIIKGFSVSFYDDDM